MIFFYLEKRGRQRSGRALWISQGGGEREPLPHSPKQTHTHLHSIQPTACFECLKSRPDLLELDYIGRHFTIVKSVTK